MANYSLERFKSEVLSNSGLARNNRFEVILTPPAGLTNRTGDADLASLYVEQTSIPLLNIFAKPFKIFGPTYQRPITSEYGGEGLPITFHVDRNMRVRKFFEDWMHLIIDKNKFTVSYQEKYIADIIIRQLDEQNNVTYEIRLREAFPRNINLMDLNNNSSNQTHRLNVLFAYRYWERTETSINDSALQPIPIIRTQSPSPTVNTSGNFFSFDSNNASFDNQFQTFDQG